MTRLPKKYFASITDYVNTYYTAWGAANFAEKAYNAVKTVTKDFTRTDPVHVRIGADGEPEIHYTIATSMSGDHLFASMTLSGVTLYVHGGEKLTALGSCFSKSTFKKIVFDSLANCKTAAQSCYQLHCDEVIFPSDFAPTNTNTMFNGSQTKKINAFDLSKASGYSFMFDFAISLEGIPAFDFSTITDFKDWFEACYELTYFHATGMKASFDLHWSTKLPHDALIEIINNLEVVDQTAGITLTLGSSLLAKLSDEEKAIATGKGWTLA